jgi:TonB family protein
MIRTLSSLALFTALGACAAAAPGANPAPARSAPEPTLPVATFIDSVALHQALLAAPPAPAGFRLRPLFRVAYDSTGVLKEVSTYSTTHFPAEYGRQMVEMLRAHVRPRITSARESWNTVWLQSGSSPKIAVLSNAVEVKPALVNTADISRELQRVSQRLQRLDPGLAGQQRTAGVSMRVSEEGVPEEPTVRRSTGSFQIDREILNVARLMRFSPATVNEYPVRVFVQIPITVVFTEQRPAPSNTTQP